MLQKELFSSRCAIFQRGKISTQVKNRKYISIILGTGKIHLFTYQLIILHTSLEKSASFFGRFFAPS